MVKAESKAGVGGSHMLGAGLGFLGLAVVGSCIWYPNLRTKARKREFRPGK